MNVLFSPERRLASLCLLLLCLLLASPGLASPHEPKAEKKAVLLVAFGTTSQKAQAAYANLDKLARQALPGVEIRWAYTSDKIRTKLNAESKQPLLSPAEALAKLAADGYSAVAVQSLQVVPAEEFHNLARTAKAFEGLPKGISKILLGDPLLCSSQDLKNAAKALLGLAPKDRSSEDALVFFGHGTRHPANVYYPGLQYYLSKLDKNALVATVEGEPSLDDAVSELRERKIKKAYLIPLMTVAGDHAENDMAGNEPESLSSRLKKAGITPVALLRGLGENEALAGIWMEHLKNIFSKL